MIPRDLPLERELTALAAQVAGCAPPTSLDNFADHRAHPGGVRADLDADHEASEELADARNYLVWGIVAVYPAYLAGDPVACALVDRRLRALSAIVLAWSHLHTEAH